MKYVPILILSLFITGSVFGQDYPTLKKLEKIEWITEQYPPLNYIDGKDGQLKGYMVDILIEIWKTLGLKRSRTDIITAPWARGIKMLKKSPNVCLFSMGINKEREKEFYFVGPVQGLVTGLIAKKTAAFNFNSINDVNRVLKNIGFVRDDLGGKMFIERGGNSNLLHPVQSGESLVRMLERNRFDAISYGEIPTIKNMEVLGINVDDYEVAFVLRKGSGNFSFNKDVDPDILQAMQKAFDKIDDDGIIDQIQNTYIKRFDRKSP